MAEWKCLPRKQHNTGCSSQPLRRHWLGGRWDEGGLVCFLSSAEPPRLSATCRKRTVARAASAFRLPPVKTTWAVTQVLHHFLQMAATALLHRLPNTATLQEWTSTFGTYAEGLQQRWIETASSKAEQDLFKFFLDFRVNNSGVTQETSPQPMSRRNKQKQKNLAAFKQNLGQFITGHRG